MKTNPVHGAPPVKILVVDDQWTIRMLNKRLLEKSGFVVTAAGSGKEALQYLENENYDLMLLDILMPDMSGSDVLETVRKKHSKAEFPVIMVTAKRKNDDIARALSLGANDYMVKPFNLDALIACIKNHLPDAKGISSH